MSETIDQKVVEMRFDNQQFEQGVSQTMGTLQKLKSALKIDGAVAGLEGMGKAMSNLGLNGVSNDISNITTKTSTLQNFISQYMIGAIRQLGAETTTWLKNTVKSMSGFENLQKGWAKFGEKTVSVATIQAQGYALEEVNEQLAKLNWFTDETSYNFTDMVENIGKFTATGQHLDESVVAMQGIANWAALSGQNAQTASRAMYNIAQAMSQGAMKMQDWKSIQIASMDTKEFREQAVQAAVAAETLFDVGHGQYELEGKIYNLNQLFSEGLSKGWFTSKVMVNTFSKYSSAVDQIYSYVEEHGGTASEAIEAMGDELDEFGIKAFKAAQQARTWADVVDSVKDAVSTGWMKTFEYIVGNSAEATALFTQMANSLWDVFASSGERRNEILEEWKELGGRTELLKALVNVIQALSNVIAPIKSAFHDVFDEVKEGVDFFDTKVWGGMTAHENYVKELAQRYVDLTTKFKDFTAKLIANEEVMKNIKITFIGVFSALNLGKEIIIDLVSELFGLDKETGTYIERASRVGKVIGALLYYVTKLIKESGIVTTSIKYIISILGSLMKIGRTILDIIAKLTGHSNGIELIISLLNGLAKALVVISKYLGYASAAIDKFSDSFGNGLLGTFNFLTNQFRKLIDIFTHMGGYIIEGFSIGITEGFTRIAFIAKQICDILVNTVCGLLGIHSPSTVFYKIGTFIIAGLVKGLIFMEPLINKVLKGISNIFLAFGVDLSSKIDLFTIIDKIIAKIQNIPNTKGFTFINTVFEKMESSIRFVVGRLKEFIKNITLADIKSIAITLSIIGVAKSMLTTAAATTKLVDAFAGMTKAVSGFFDAGKDFINTLQENMKAAAKPMPMLLQISILLGTFAASLWVISKIPKDDLERAGIAIGQFIIAIVGLAGAMALFSKYAGKERNADQLLGMAETFAAAGNAIMKASISLAAGVLIMSFALKQFDTLEHPIKSIIGMFMTLGALLVATVGIVLAIPLLIKEKGLELIKMGPVIATMIAMAFSMVLISKALAGLKGFEEGELQSCANALVEMLVAMVIASGLMRAVSITSIAGMVVMAGMLIALMPLLKKSIANASSEQLIAMGIKSIIAMCAFLVASLYMIKLMDKVGKNAALFGAGMLMFATSLIMLVAVTKLISFLKPEEIAKGIGVISLIAIFALGYMFLLGILMKHSEVTKKGALTLIALTGSLALLMGVVLALVAVSFVCKLLKVGDILKAILALAGVVAAFGMLCLFASLIKDTSFKALITLIVGITLIFLELVVLSTIPWQKLLPAAGAMVGVLVSLSVVLGMVALIAKNMQKGTVGSLILITAMLFILSVELNALADRAMEHPDAVVAAMLALMGTLLTFALCMKIISTISTYGTKAIVSLIFTAAAAAGLAFILSQLAVYDWRQMTAAGLAMSACMLAFVGAVAIMSNVVFNPANFLLLLGAALVAISIGGALAMLASQPWESILAAMGSVLLVMAALAGLSGLFALIAPVAPAVLMIFVSIAATAVAVSVGMMIMAAALNVFAMGLARFATLDWQTLGLAAASLAGLMFVFAMFGTVSPLIVAASVSLMAMSLAMAVGSVTFTMFAGALTLLSGIDILSIAMGFVALGVAGATMFLGMPGYLATLAVLAASIPILMGYSMAVLASSAMINGAFMLGVADIPIKMQQAGVDAVKGLLEGVAQNQGMSQMAGSLLASAFIIGFRQISLWASPWGTMQIAGVDANKGLAKGTQKSLPLAYASGEATAGTYLEAVNEADIPGNMAEVAEESAEALSGVTEESKQLMTGFYDLINDGSEESMKKLGELSQTALQEGKITGDQYREITDAVKGLGDAQYEVMYTAQKETHSVWAEGLQEDIKGAKSDLEIFTGSIGMMISDIGTGDFHPVDNIKEAFSGKGKAVGQMFGMDFITGLDGIIGDFDLDFDTSDFMKEFMGYDVDVNSNYIEALRKSGMSQKDIDARLEKEGYIKKGKKWVRHVKGSLEVDMGEAFNFGDFDEDGGLGDIESAGKSLNEVIEDSISIFSRFNDVTKDTSLTGNKLLGNMKSQIDGTRKWAESIASLNGKISDEFYSELLNQGVDSYETVIELMDMSSAQLYYADELYKRKTTDAAKYAKDLSGSLTDETQAFKMTEEQIDAYNLVLSDYAMQIVDVEEGTDVTKEQVQQMAAAVMAANPQLATMGKTLDDVAIDILAFSTDITTMADDIKDSLEGSLNMFEQFSTKAARTPKDMFKALLTQRAGMESWAEDMVKLADRGLDEGILEKLRELGTDGADTVKAFVNMTDKELEIYSDLFYDVKDSPEALSKALSMAMHGASVEFSDSIEGMTADMVLLKYQISDTIESSMDAFSKFDTSKISMEEMTRDLVSQLAGSADWTISLGKLAKKGINENLLKELESAGPKSYKYVKALSKSSEKGLKEYNMLWEMYSTDWSTILADAYARGDIETVKFAQNFIDHFDDIEDATFRTMEDVKAELKDSIKSSISMFKEYDSDFELTPDKALANVKSQVEGVKKWSQNLQTLAGKGISDEFLDYLTSLGPQGAEEINAIVQMSASQLAETDKYVQEALKLDETESQKIVDSYEAAGRNFNEGLLNGLDIQGTYDQFTKLADAGLLGIMTTWDEHSPSKKAEQLGSWFNEGLGNGILKGPAAKYMALEALAIKAKAKSELSEKSGRTIGINLLKGIAIGIRENMNVPVNAAKAMATNLLRQVKTIFGINSPSKEFRTIGRYDCEGLAKGLEEYSRIVYDSGSTVAHEVMDGFKDTYSGIVSVIDWDDLSPVIKPEMDLSNVVDGVQRISEMMNQNKINTMEMQAKNNLSDIANRLGNTFIQNNYSPKSLSRVDIYRQTKNLISTANARGAMA